MSVALTIRAASSSLMAFAMRQETRRQERRAQCDCYVSLPSKERYMVGSEGTEG